MSRPQSAVRGFTLVELLVVISIIGVLMSLLLPAINAARESGRKTQCLSNLKQIGLACLQHEEKHRRYPTGGWGPTWVGYADGGNNVKQPGGWFYNILPYLDGTALHDLGQAETNDAVMQNDILRQVEATQAIANCPTRRSTQTWPMNTSAPVQTLYDPLGTTVSISGVNVARGDYAANAGVRYDKASATATTDTENMFGCYVDPSKGGTDFPSSYRDNKGNVSTTFNNLWRFTGVIFQRSTIGQNNVKDGASKTYLIGEKFVARDHTEDGFLYGDQYTLYSGMGADNYRTTCIVWSGWPTDTPDGKGNLPSDPGGAAIPTTTGATAPNTTMLNDQKDPGNLYGCIFGSAHSGIVNFTFCDGSTKSISTSIDPLTHRYLGERNDGKILDDAMIGQ